MSPFSMMNWMFLGLASSVFYGLVGWLLITVVNGSASADDFFAAYTIKFNTVLSFGVAIGTAAIVYCSQRRIPHIIEAAFRGVVLPREYEIYKRRYGSRSGSIDMCTQFAIAAFVLFGDCHFPVAPFFGETLMILAASAEVALGVYIARKLCYAGMMLHSLRDVTVRRNLFRDRELDEIDTFVHIASTLTVVFAYIHIRSYYKGPFVYDRFFGQSMKIFLLAPIVFAVPVLAIFNFYPREVLRRIYGQSIQIAIKRLRRVLHREGLSEYEKRSYLLEVDRMSREEVRYTLQQAIGDLPLAVTILIMLLQPFLGK